METTDAVYIDAVRDVTNASLALEDDVPESYGILSDAQAKLASDILIIIRHVVMAFALPLTVINIVVFWQKDMRSATSVYVIGTSLSQLYRLVNLAVISVLFETLPDPMTDYLYWTWSVYVGAYGDSCARRGGYLVMCLVSMERLYAILRPLHVKSFFLSRRPVLCTTLSFILAAVLHVYIPAKTYVKEFRNEATGRVIARPHPTALYLQQKDVNDAFSLTAKILLSYTTLLMQIVLNVLTICCLKRHNVAHKTTVTSTATDDVKQRQERQMTVTILAATISYVAFSLPFALHNFVYTVWQESYSLYGRYGNLYTVVMYLTVDLTLFSCGVDFVCFMTLSSSYRKTYFRLTTINRTKPATTESSTTVTKQ